MTYVALLRGINVGGNNKVEMKKLKSTFEALGFKQVRTYINTGNIIFSDTSHTQEEISDTLETAIFNDFNLEIKVLVKNFNEIHEIAATLPSTWVNDATMKCDVMFLWEDVDSPTILDSLDIKPEIDQVKYVSGALIWKVDRENVTRSGMMELVGTKLYKQMTIRNCNTLRKLLKLMQEVNPTNKV